MKRLRIKQRKNEKFYHFLLSFPYKNNIITIICNVICSIEKKFTRKKKTSYKVQI